MISKPRSISLVAAAVSAILFALTQPPIARAAVTARSDNNLTVISGSVQVFATANPSNTSTGVALSTLISNNSPKTFYVNNSGNLAVSRFIMTITLPSASNISSFRRCPLNVAFTGTNICASGSATVLTNPTSGAATTYVLPLPGAGFYSFQITQNKTGTMTVSTSASLSNFTGGVTNS